MKQDSNLVSKIKYLVEEHKLLKEYKRSNQVLREYVEFLKERLYGSINSNR